MVTLSYASLAADRSAARGRFLIGFPHATPGALGDTVTQSCAALDRAQKK